jgi:hypothetical protein
VGGLVRVGCARRDLEHVEIAEHGARVALEEFDREIGTDCTSSDVEMT